MALSDASSFNPTARQARDVVAAPAVVCRTPESLRRRRSDAGGSRSAAISSASSPTPARRLRRAEYLAVVGIVPDWSERLAAQRPRHLNATPIRLCNRGHKPHISLLLCEQI